MNAFQIDATLRTELWHTVKSPTVSAQSEIRQKVLRAETTPPTVAEQRLLELLIHDAQLRRILSPRIAPDDYKDLPTEGVFRALAEIEAAGAEVDFTTLGEHTEGDPLASDLVPLLLMSEPVRDEGEAMDEVLMEAEKCLHVLRMMRLERRLKDLAIEIAAAERAGDTERRDALVMENLKLKRGGVEILLNPSGV
jgi:hypothetical protein